MRTGHKLKFAFAGDLMLGGDFLDFAEDNKLDYLYPFQALPYYFHSADVILVNLEGPVHRSAQSRPDATALLSNHQEVLNLFDHGNECVFNLANNHIMDYGTDGLAKTLRYLKENGLNRIGAEHNKQDATRELILKRKGKRIALLSYTTDEPHVNAVIAGNQIAGCASFQDFDEVVYKIRKLQKKVDVICISMHWGHEYHSYPAPEQIQMAHALVDAGANYIIGHHPHVVQGVENYNGALIVYSLGNFFMPTFRFTSGRPKLQDRDEKEFMLVLAEMDDQAKINYELVGGYQTEQYRLLPYQGGEKKSFQTKIQILSKPFKLSSYKEFWVQYSERRKAELQKRNLRHAFKKFTKASLADLKHITFGDMKRQASRLRKIIFA